MKRYGMRLVAGSVGGGEVESCSGEEARCDETAVRNCLSSGLLSINRESSGRY